MEIISAIALFIGAWLSWNVGYRLNDWVRKLFLYRVKTTPTRIEFRPATPVEIEQKYERKVHELEREYDRKVHELERNLSPEPKRILSQEETLEKSLAELTNDQIQDLVLILNDVREGLTEEEVINTFADNMKYVAKRKPLYDHLDL